MQLTSYRSTGEAVKFFLAIITGEEDISCLLDLTNNKELAQCVIDFFNGQKSYLNTLDELISTLKAIKQQTSLEYDEVVLAKAAFLILEDTTDHEEDDDQLKELYTLAFTH